MEVLGLVLLALSLGVVSVVQSVTNGIASARIGLPTTILINAAVVFAGAVVVWAVTRNASAAVTGKTPWYLLLGGLYGLTFLVTAAFVFPRLGAGPATALMVAAQLTLALVFDHLGPAAMRVPVTPARLLGAVLLLAGALLVLWPKLRA